MKISARRLIVMRRDGSNYRPTVRHLTVVRTAVDVYTPVGVRDADLAETTKHDRKPTSITEP